MYHQKKQENTIVSQQILLEDGIDLVKSKQQEHLVDTDDTLFLTKKIQNLSYMHGSLHLNKNQIYKIKSNICKKNIRHMNLSQTSDLVSTLNGKGLTPFWTNYSMELSKKLWLPQKIDLPGSDLTCLKTSLLDSVQHSYISIQPNSPAQKKNCQATSYQSLQFSQQDIMGKENIKYKTRRIRFYPTKEQKIYFNKCFGTTRYIYNKIIEFFKNKYISTHNNLKIMAINGCVKTIKDKQCCNKIYSNSKYFCKKHSKSKIKMDYKLNLQWIRKQILINDKDLPDDLLWLKEIPYDTRQLVIKDFIAAYKAAITNLKKGNHTHFNMGFKCKHKPTQMFHIDKRAIDINLNLFKKRKIGNLRTRRRMKRWIKNNLYKIECNSKIIRYNPDQYYLLLTVPLEKKEEPATFKSVSLDPGVRTFQTFYSPDGVCGKLGDDIVNKRLYKIGSKIDLLESVTTQKNKSKKTIRNIRKRQSLLRTKIKNVVNDLHWKVADFLCKNFETIILPTFDVQDMTSNQSGTRTINSKATRKMLTL